MLRATSLFIAMAAIGHAVGSSHSVPEVCKEIEHRISGDSSVYYPGSANYDKDISHMWVTSTENATCSFEPGNTKDIAAALDILGRTRTPFAVKGGGHASNPKFSSTTGVQISMTRFSEVDYDAISQTATIGTGLVWDDVYAVLEQYGVNVVGGRVQGVGVAGFTLGGGYSWLTNQHGLTIDNLLSFEVVVPNGTVFNVTETSSPDLFFALKGGGNNFGIVTKFTLNTYPQTKVWGGPIYYPPNVTDQVNEAIAEFSANSIDPKAQILPSYNYVSGQVSPLVMIFYDAPTPPTGLFDKFLQIPSIVDNITTRAFTDHVKTFAGAEVPELRGLFNAISVTGFPLSFIESVVSEVLYWGKKLGDSASTVSIDIEPFLPSIFSHNTTPTAYPPDRSHALYPINFYFAWLSPESDKLVEDAIRSSKQRLLEAAIRDGVSTSDAVVYSNNAIFGTPLQNLYGNNVERLHKIHSEVDPRNVMGLAGGFKL